MFIHGKGANGKGVFVKTVSEIMGDYAIGVAQWKHSSQRSLIDIPSRSPPSRAHALVVAQETQRGTKLG